MSWEASFILPLRFQMVSLPWDEGKRNDESEEETLNEGGAREIKQRRGRGGVSGLSQKRRSTHMERQNFVVLAISITAS